jgi:hypothetical protein
VIWTLFAAQPVWVPEHEVFGPVESSPAALAIPGAQAVHTLVLTWWLMRQFSALANNACRQYYGGESRCTSSEPFLVDKRCFG